MSEMPSPDIFAALLVFFGKEKEVKVKSKYRCSSHNVINLHPIKKLQKRALKKI